ncbi:MAG: FeoB-associated Cys-rich membrane protein [Firmicutes bacterium]|nr:FeoB-associated Cys-rich membrane protein [Bacillota bacterium]
MFTWIYENLGTIIIGAILAAVVAAVIVHMIHNKKKGRSSCGCGCSSCAINGTCHPKK